jgi:predicted transcriptional regulator
VANKKVHLELKFSNAYIIGKSQNWLAKQVNVTPAHISLIIAGKVTPSQPVLKDIATALGLESSELVKYLF